MAIGGNRDCRVIGLGIPLVVGVAQTSLNSCPGEKVKARVHIFCKPSQENEDGNKTNRN